MFLLRGQLLRLSSEGHFLVNKEAEICEDRHLDLVRHPVSAVSVGAPNGHPPPVMQPPPPAQHPNHHPPPHHHQHPPPPTYAPSSAAAVAAMAASAAAAAAAGQWPAPPIAAGAP